MRYVYSVNSIGLNIVFFASKKAALNYANKHNIPKLSNGKWGIIRTTVTAAVEVREDFNNIRKQEDIHNGT